MFLLLLLLIPSLITEALISDLELIEGDIIISSPRGKRQLSTTTAKWSDNTVPYTFHDSIKGAKKAVLLDAMTHISTRTCIKFTENYDPSKSYLIFKDGGGCWSHIGRLANSGQEISIGDGCGLIGNAVHEIMHALGIHHTHNRHDRDLFVSVSETNNPNFQIDNLAELVVPYEYGSTMHYGYNQFEGVYVTPKQPEFLYTMGSRRVSFYDMVKINKLYQCSCDKELSCENGGYSNPAKCSKCVCPSGYSGKLCDKPPFNSNHLMASQNWEDYSLTLTPRSSGTSYSYTTKTIIVHAPADKTIQVQIMEMDGFSDTYGCRMNGIEVKYMGDPRIVNPIHCSNGTIGSIFTGKLNPMPIIFYKRDDTISKLGFRYRYLDIPLSNLTKGTNGYDNYEYYQ